MRAGEKDATAPPLVRSTSERAGGCRCRSRSRGVVHRAVESRQPVYNIPGAVRLEGRLEPRSAGASDQ